jgi:hypothetical protein
MILFLAQTHRKVMRDLFFTDLAFGGRYASQPCFRGQLALHVAIAGYA